MHVQYVILPFYCIARNFQGPKNFIFNTLIYKPCSSLSMLCNWRTVEPLIKVTPDVALYVYKYI